MAKKIKMDDTKLMFGNKFKKQNQKQKTNKPKKTSRK